MVFANDFTGKNDSEIINNAVKNRGEDGIVVISPRTIDETRDYWLLDSAVLLPENTVVVLQNVRIKLSDFCRDNFFRTANCGLGIEEVVPIKNVHIRGEGGCLLEGADHPRASGDSGKRIHKPCPQFSRDIDGIPEEGCFSEKMTFNQSYGSDAGKEEESQYGDWRGIGVLFANTDEFSISGIRIKDSHCWAISLEACSNGRIEKIDFDSRMRKQIDGICVNIKNQDGIDLRNGCHHIVISDITGCTGDDVIALTAIAKPGKYRPSGSLRSTHVMHNDWSRREKDIHDVIIRNIIAESYFCWNVRLLPVRANIYNIVIDGIINTKTAVKENFGGTMLLGDGGNYGDNLPDSMRNVSISNVISNGKNSVVIGGFLTDSVITNVVNKNPECKAVDVCRENGAKNVVISNIVEATK